MNGNMAFGHPPHTFTGDSQKETQFPLLNSMSKTDTVEKLACLLTGEAIMMSGPI